MNQTALSQPTPEELRQGLMSALVLLDKSVAMGVRVQKVIVQDAEPQLVYAGDEQGGAR